MHSVPWQAAGPRQPQLLGAEALTHACQGRCTQLQPRLTVCLPALVLQQQQLAAQ